VRYRGDVPGDWIARVTRELGVSPTLLGADIDIIDGQVVGSATIAVPHRDASRLAAFLSEFGLDARPLEAPSPISTSAPVSDTVPALEVVA